MDTPHEHLTALHRAAFDVATQGGTLDQLAAALNQCLHAECGLWPIHVAVGDETLIWETGTNVTAAGVQVTWTDGLGPKELSLGTLQAIH